MRVSIILGIAVALVLLQGCGRKGPLKLPAPQAQIPQAQPSSAPPTQQVPAPGIAP